ncbi:glycosyltransferase family 39 protein [Patescibacteria group bacterium]|nr:glycosyltransferase family 39 protein [Patescibacteria group bacterium]MBU1123363.1 glycosyltransferase family 39 protein [Patescibacteria group bacterium]
MISLLIFLGITLLLIAEGWLILSLIGIPRSYLKFFLSLPTAALPNSLIILIITLANLSLHPTTIISLHMIIIIALTIIVISKRKEQLANLPTSQLANLPPTQRFIITTTCSTLLLITFIYGFSHAVLLPTFHYDSVMNWNNRSKISFIEKQLVLTDHHELIAKPHYPILYHSLQITTQQGQSEWSDRLGNLIHFLLSISSLAALFLMIKKLRGSVTSLIALTVITTTPLFAMHMGGSYADVPLTLFALLSLASFFLYNKTNEFRWIILSAIFVSACVWTKSEGIPFCAVPWGLMMVLCWWRSASSKMKIVYGIIIAVVLSMLWPMAALIKGLPLSPHGANDMGFALQDGALPVALKVIFMGGSFGVVLPLVILLTLLSPSNRTHKYGLLWGILSLAGIIFIYTFTSNAQYLINGQSFDRQMLLPVAILILTIFSSDSS